MYVSHWHAAAIAQALFPSLQYVTERCVSDVANSCYGQFVTVQDGPEINMPRGTACMATKVKTTPHGSKISAADLLKPSAAVTETVSHDRNSRKHQLTC